MLATLQAPGTAAGQLPPEDAARLERVAALAAMPDAPGLRPGDREALDAALASLGPSPPPSTDPSPARWAGRLWDWFLNLLGTPEAERYASAGRLAFLGALGGAAAATLWALRRRRARRGLAAASVPPAVSSPDDGEAAARRAEDALARGATAEAVRHAFLSALATLERRGRLPRRRDLTNRELASELGGAQDGVAATWGWLAARFERAVYGRAPVNPVEALEVLARSRALRRQLDRSAR